MSKYICVTSVKDIIDKDDFLSTIKDRLRVEAIALETS